MKVVEFGRKDAPVAVLLHGGGLSWWNYREAARLLQQKMRVVLPLLDGHAGSDRHFTSIEDNAREVIGSEEFSGVGVDAVGHAQQYLQCRFVCHARSSCSG